MPIQKRRKTKLSEVVIRKQRPAVDIKESASSNAEPVADDLRSFLLRGLPDGETLPDVALFLVILGNIVLHDSEAMEAADEAHFDALSLLNRLQLVRDDFKGRLVPTLTDIRDTFNTAFGTDSCQRILGLGVEFPAETLRVRRLGDRVLRLLTATDFELPPVVSDVVCVDIVKWVDQLKPDLTGLRQTMDLISEAKRESERTLAAKTAAVETYQTSFVRCSQLLEAFFKVSGNEHLADKLRPPTPKSKTVADTGEPTEPPEPDAEQAAETDEAEEDEVAERQAPASSRALPDQPLTEARPDRPPAEARSDPSPAEA